MTQVQLQLWWLLVMTGSTWDVLFEGEFTYCYTACVYTCLYYGLCMHAGMHVTTRQMVAFRHVQDPRKHWDMNARLQ